MKLSFSQQKVLLLLRDSDNAFCGCCGMAEHGGRVGTLRSLNRRELIVYNALQGLAWLTEKGKAAVKEIENV